MAPNLVYEEVTDELGAILNREFVTDFRSGYVTVEGAVLPDYFREFGDSIKSLRTREDDVWVCSFPKCGTTWAQEMIWLISNDLDYEAAKTPLPERFPFLEHSPLFDYREISKKFPEFEVPRFVTDSVGYIDDIKGQRFIKTHLPYSLLPEQIWNNSQSPKIIYTCRDVKDCIISYFHHCKLMEGYTGNFEDFYKLFLGGRVTYAPFWPHALGYWERRHQPNILFLKYEDMKADLPSVVKRVCSFLGKSYSEDQLEELCQHLSFESMKNNPSVNYEPISELNRKFGLISAEGHFMRAGKVGDYKAHMTEDQVEKVEKWSEDFLKGTGWNQ